MNSFLQRVAQKLLEKPFRSLKDIVVIMPSRRGSIFLQKELSKLINKPVLSPEITTVEDFIFQQLEMKQENQASLLFKLYQSYTIAELKNKEDFADFIKWGPVLLADFNEVDRYLLDVEDLFYYLADVKRLENWNLNPPEQITNMVYNYLHFWEILPSIYRHFTKGLQESKRVYQGLAYRLYADGIGQYSQVLRRQYEKLYLVGFSALNAAEEKIFDHFYKENIACFIWDIDRYYFEDRQHEAGKFLRKNPLVKKQIEKKELISLENELAQSSKNIQIIATAGDTLQAIAAHLEVLKLKPQDWERTVLVLAEKNLLFPVLNNLPAEVPSANVTMGIPLKASPLSNFFSLLLEIHVDHEKLPHKDIKGHLAFHYQKWDDLLSHYEFQKALQTKASDIEKLRKIIKQQNCLFLSVDEVRQLLSTQIPKIVSQLFEDYTFKPAELFSSLKLFCEWLKKNTSGKNYILETLYSFYRIFKEMKELLEENEYIKDMDTSWIFYRNLLHSETLDLYGEPLEGLQIMGMLETRNLDFENIVITSLNEGVLPQGHTHNSFIPFEIRVEKGLPTYLDKDSVYAYHFYRLLQRAKNIVLIYNNHTDGLVTGEPSRFIKQLQFEFTQKNPKLNISHKTVSRKIKKRNKERSIEKTPFIIQRLQKMCQKGLSATTLIDYINDPVEFYYKRVLQIQETEKVEEEISFNTRGTVVHEVLKELYSTEENSKRGILKELNSHLTAFSLSRKEIDQKVLQKLGARFNFKNLDKGKNYLIREILNHMIFNFLQREKKELDQSPGFSTQILGLEQKLEWELKLEEGTIVKLIGLVDRIDQREQKIRIIDYKTGVVYPKELSLINWEEITSPLQKSKAFQLMMYAYLYIQNNPQIPFVESSIISLRNISYWCMPLKMEKESKIDQKLALAFEAILKELITEILVPDLPFVRKSSILENDE